MTAVHASRSTGSSPTLKVIQLPRPTRGSASPLPGSSRVSGSAARARVAAEGSAVTAAAASRPRSSRRRDRGGRGWAMMRSWQC
ncbi:hypothetical protein [Halomonas ventosae]|uniref:hypothetical protein n=1 Tax=Halomonas ventosae TaxID=229007 RepID=UPI002159198B|nr:hypothetical protein [Halomonas ventosae]